MRGKFSLSEKSEPLSNTDAHGEDEGHGTLADRGLAEGIGYVFALGILTLFVGGSMLAGVTLLEDSTASAQDEQLEWEAERIAWAYEDVDRSVRASGSDAEISEVVDLPDEIAGDNYQIRVEATPTGGFVNLSLRGADVETSVEFYTETLVATKEVTGGSVRVLRRSDGTGRVTLEKMEDPE